MKRQSREETKASTRRRLLAAADHLFSRHGYRDASLEAIAARAGVTTGAVYGLFENKVDLFLKCYDASAVRRLSELAQLAEEAPGETSTAAAVRQWIARSDRDRGWLIAWFEFRMHATRDRRLNAEVARRNGQLIDGISEMYEEALREAGADDPKPWGMAIARAFVALGNGYAIERWNDPDRAPLEGLIDPSEALVSGMWARAVEGAPVRARS